MEKVQRRKQEIFKKRQEELKKKLKVKENRRKLLSENNWSYTPKLRKSTPVKSGLIANPNNGSIEKNNKEKVVLKD